MNAESKAVIWSVVTVLLVGALATVLLGIHRRQRVTLQGAVIREDSDPQKRQPIPDVQITATAGLTVGQVKSDASGFFSLKLPKGFRRQPVTFEFHHPDYRPLILHESGGEELIHRTYDSPGPQPRCRTGKRIRRSQNRSFEYPREVLDQDHGRGRRGERGKDFRSRECWQRALPRPTSLFARRKMESGH